MAKYDDDSFRPLGIFGSLFSTITLRSSQLEQKLESHRFGSINVHWNCLKNVIFSCSIVKSWIHDTKLNFTVNFFPFSFFFLGRQQSSVLFGEWSSSATGTYSTSNIVSWTPYKKYYRRKQVRLPLQFYHIVTLEKHHTSKHNGRGKQKNRTLRNGRKWL